MEAKTRHPAGEVSNLALQSVKVILKSTINSPVPILDRGGQRTPRSDTIVKKC